MKKIVAIFIVITILCMPISCFASETNQQYVYSNGDLKVRYYLDDEGRPYCYENNKVVYMLLPVGTHRLSVEESNALNSLIDDNETLSDAVTCSNAPTSWYDMSAFANGTKLKSVKYTTFVNFDLMSKVVTPPLKVNSKLVNLNIVSANMDKKLFSGKKITIKIELYDKVDDVWEAFTYTDNYTGEGVNYIFYPSVVPYVRLTITKSSSGVKNFDLEVHTWGTA